MEPVFHFQEMFEQSLGLTDPWKVIRAEFNERDRAVHVYLEGRKTAKYPCPICGKEKVRYDEEDEERVWRHADVVMYPCYIHCRRPRVKCETDGIRVVDAPWTRGKYARFTLAFEGYAMLLAGNMSLNEACRILRISRTAMVHIALYWVNRSVAQTRLEEVTRLSVEETAMPCDMSAWTCPGHTGKGFGCVFRKRKWCMTDFT